MGTTIICEMSMSAVVTRATTHIAKVVRRNSDSDNYDQRQHTSSTLMSSVASLDLLAVIYHDDDRH